MYYKNILELKGIGEKTAALYNRLGIYTWGDLLSHYPQAYEKYEPPVSLCEAPSGELCALKLRLRSPISSRKGKKVTVFTCTAGDATGTIKLIFFNIPYIRSVFKPGQDFIFRGTITEGTMSQPAFYTVTDYDRLLSGLSPRYPLTKGLTHKGVAKAVRTALESWDIRADIPKDSPNNTLKNISKKELNDIPDKSSGDITEDTPASDLPSFITEKYSLIPHNQALHKIHFPLDAADVALGRERLSFEEFFYFIYMVKTGRADTITRTSPYEITASEAVRAFADKLPYELTGAQRATIDDIERDMTSGGIMNRLVQGDVGSGKTIISIMALLMVAASGYQGALMAPTEVLSVQHYENIVSLTEKYDLPFKPVILTGSMSASRKREAYKLIESGEANVIIGTHALIQEKVRYKDLALVVTDEQHRFGVRQRESFSEKGWDVHVLVMSATPIPRTLALILYGDLSISVVGELPASRVPIKNTLLGPENREKAWRFLLKEIQKGHQAYIICPMVEEGEMDGVENVTDYTGRLREALPSDVRISMLHGRMKGADKNRIMEEFSRGDADILVSTTVIEVGIDVPNATVILIENSERFGLSQLHQLRGRTGRGADQSYCIFLTGSEKALSTERLDVISHTNDGFKIAEEDLRLRGPGDLMGIRQSGELAFKVADICRDSDILKSASEAVEDCIARGVEVSYPEWYDLSKAVL